ncbi:MAG: DUF937 domain-containing protein [Bryobacterales bacterium]|nr:DUF937 domain-containing protein [Bryobacterales bacterium]
MDLLQMILNAQGGNAVSNLGERFGLSQEQTASAVGSLLPALMGGMQKNVEQQGGLDSLLGALSGGHHQRYVEDPDAIRGEQPVAEGNGILGHLLGSKDVSRQVASAASARTGVGSDVLKQMLPIVASMMMGAMSKQTGGGRTAAASAGGGGGILDMLTPMLDRDGDGSALDDVAGMLGGFFKK